tara:strand:- start:163 stop:411 length:249 start_codon:yes stop_codon:yes gene_type:complete
MHHTKQEVKDNMKIEYRPEEKSISFSWKERLLILTRGKLVFAPVDFKHFCNCLFNLLVEFQKKFDPKLQKISTNPNDDIKTS